jgi:hypothetical protein
MFAQISLFNLLDTINHWAIANLRGISAASWVRLFLSAAMIPVRIRRLPLKCATARRSVCRKHSELQVSLGGSLREII